MWFSFLRLSTKKTTPRHRLADFEIILSMRERTPLPTSLINRLTRLQMLGITGSRVASLDLAACNARGIVVCNTEPGAGAEAATAELALGLLIDCGACYPGWGREYPGWRFPRGLARGN